jgi:hypothetical protein
VLVGDGVPGAGVPLFPEGVPITTPAQPLPTIEAAIMTAIKHFEISFAPDLVSPIVRQL